MRYDADALLIAEGEQPRDLLDGTGRYDRLCAAVKELAMVGEEGFDIQGIREHEPRLPQNIGQNPGRLLIAAGHAAIITPLVFQQTFAH
jgi:hypothetical protein